MVEKTEVRAGGIDPALAQLLEGICDPEIPVLNIVEMGIVRSAEVAGSSALVRITPTYSGCPAMAAIEREIAARLEQAGFEPRVETVFDEAWTTDWMSAESREKLRQYGIAPPSGSAASSSQPVGCPRFGSNDTEVTSYFGSTACKSLFVCKACSEPFEAFKCI